MAKYTSKPVTVAAAAETISEKFADLTRLEGSLSNIPQSEREAIGEVKFEPDSLSIVTRQVGELKFKVVERSADKVVFETVSSPLPLKLNVDLKPLGAESTEITTSVDAELPAMLRPLLGGMMQKAADSFGELIAKINR